LRETGWFAAKRKLRARAFEWGLLPGILHNADSGTDTGGGLPVAGAECPARYVTWPDSDLGVLWLMQGNNPLTITPFVKNL
jgi:hypothetical protein